MSIGRGQPHESHFGPTSELIDISQFLESAWPEAAGHARADWLSWPEDQRHEIIEECRVDDLRSMVDNVIVNPLLMAYMTRSHDSCVQSVHETADTSNRKKRKRVSVAEPDQEQPEVSAFHNQLDAIQLKSWPLLLNSALFIRTSRNSDSNTLNATKQLCFEPPPTNSRHAAIFVTVYERLQWGHRLVARSSQHVLLSSQTLADFVRSIPCISKEGPAQFPGDPSEESKGIAVHIESTLYGEDRSRQDYARVLTQYLQPQAAADQDVISDGPPMKDVPFGSLKIRLHKPYWLIHAGDCEHFFVVELVRLYHPSDPPLDAFPLTTQITPPLLDVCRACNKVPAVYSILGDLRLGESPFVICEPCWRWMGTPTGEAAQSVSVVPLPSYRSGWELTSGETS